MSRPSLAEREAALNEGLGDDIKNRNKKGKGKKFFLNLSDYKDVVFQKLKEGMNNRFDVIPFEVTVPENMPIDKRPKAGRLCYKVILWVHPNIGKNNSSIVCPKKNFDEPCPICEEIDSLFASGKTKDDPEVSNLFATRKAIYNTKDYLDSEHKMICKLLIASGAKFDDVLMEAAFNDRYDPNDPNDREFIPFANLTNGYTLDFKGLKDGFRNKKGEYINYLEFTKFDFLKREKPYTEEILKQVYPLDKMIVRLSYDEILAIHQGIVTDDDDQQDSSDNESTPSNEVPTATKEDTPEPSKVLVDAVEKEANATVEQITDGPTEEDKPSYGVCPNGFDFGYDCDDPTHIDTCNSCDKWDDCEDAQREIKRKKRAQS